MATPAALKTKPLPTLCPCATRAASLRAELKFLLKASRPGFWLTAMWFYLLPLGSPLPLTSFSFWLGLFYVGFPLGMLIYAANDIGDVATDRLNPRKDNFLFGARPSEQQRKTLPWSIAFIQLPFVGAFVYLLGAGALLWFAAIVAMTLLYNWPRFGAKDKPGFDVLAQIGYLLVFVLSNWINGLPVAPWYIYAFGALFAMHSHLFGEIMDIEPDRAAKRLTTAVVIGSQASKCLIIALLIIEAVLASQITAKPWLTLFLVAAVLWFLLDAFVLWRTRPYAPWQMLLFFIGWNVVLVAEILWSALFQHTFSLLSIL